MSLDSKIVWSEGMFLNPQHFQQQERYFERYVNSKCDTINHYGWGVTDLEIDQELLKLGKFSLVKAKGIFPDGTPFNFPDIDELPPIIDLPTNLHDTTIHIGVPLRRPGAIDVLPKDDIQSLTRYVSSELPIRDVTEEGSENLKVKIAKLRAKLLLDTDDLSGYSCVSIIRISETREDKSITIDDQYIPCCMDVNASARLSGFLIELAGLLRHRAESIVGRLGDTTRGGTAEISDYMLLQLINRVEPFINHLSSLKGLHPLRMYGEVVQVVGELCTFLSKDKRPPFFPAYLHDNLTDTFVPLLDTLRECLSMVYEQTAVAMELVEKGFGVHVSEIKDRSMLTSGRYILAVRADVTDDVIRQRFPAQIKIGPVELIRQLVNAAMQGIPIKILGAAPREIPFRAGTTYFELERHNNFWKELQTSGGFALHIGGEFPGLEMEFWAIRQWD